MANKLDQNFYCREDVNEIARELLGKVIYTNIDGVVTGAKIVETEAYSYIEKASHAYGQRLTNRTEVMFGPGGHAYVYLCYGIHELFNIVTNDRDKAEAILIRAVEPVVGKEIMKLRRKVSDLNLTSGPGKLTRALGITRGMNGMSLLSDNVWIEQGDLELSRDEIVETTRIGVEYAHEDALLPWRYYIRNNPFVSRK